MPDERGDRLDGCAIARCSSLPFFHRRAAQNQAPEPGSCLLRRRRRRLRPAAAARRRRRRRRPRATARPARRRRLRRGRRPGRLVGAHHGRHGRHGRRRTTVAAGASSDRRRRARTSRVATTAHRHRREPAASPCSPRPPVVSPARRAPLRRPAGRCLPFGASRCDVRLLESRPVRCRLDVRDIGHGGRARGGRERPRTWAGDGVRGTSRRACETTCGAGSAQLRRAARDARSGRRRPARPRRSAVATTAPTFAAAGAPPVAARRARPRSQSNAGHGSTVSARPRSAERGAARRTGAQVRLQRAALVAVERASREALHGDAVEPVAEDEMLGKPVARREERLLDLGRREPELGRRLVDPQPVQLAQDVDAPLPVGQRRERRDERAGARRARTARRAARAAPPTAARAAVRRGRSQRCARSGRATACIRSGTPAVPQRAVRLEQRRLRDVVAGAPRRRAGARRRRPAGARSGGTARRTQPPRPRRGGCRAVRPRAAEEQTGSRPALRGATTPADWPSRSPHRLSPPPPPPWSPPPWPPPPSWSLAVVARVLVVVGRESRVRVSEPSAPCVNSRAPRRSRGRRTGRGPAGTFSTRLMVLGADGDRAGAERELAFDRARREPLPRRR